MMNWTAIWAVNAWESKTWSSLETRIDQVNINVRCLRLHAFPGMGLLNKSAEAMKLDPRQRRVLIRVFIFLLVFIYVGYFPTR